MPVELFVDGSSYPHINRHTVNAMISEQRGAVGNLIADALYAFELFNQIFVVQIVYRLKVYIFLIDIFYCVCFDKARGKLNVIDLLIIVIVIAALILLFPYNVLDERAED